MRKFFHTVRRPALLLVALLACASIFFFVQPHQAHAATPPAPVEANLTPTAPNGCTQNWLHFWYYIEPTFGPTFAAEAASDCGINGKLDFACYDSIGAIVHYEDEGTATSFNYYIGQDYLDANGLPPGGFCSMTFQYVDQSDPGGYGPLYIDNLFASGAITQYRCSDSTFAPGNYTVCTQL